MIRPTLAAAALAGTLLATGCHREAAAPEATHAWVRLPAVPGRPGAAYFTIHGGRRAARLIRLESALVGRIELHESMAGMGGMATMRPSDGVDVPQGADIAFSPSGRHAMLFGIDRVVTPGTAIPLRLGFADGSTAETEAKTVAAGEDAPY